MTIPRFDIDDITEGGVEWEGDMEPSWLEPLLTSQFALGDGRIHLVISLQRKGKNVLADCRFSGDLTFACSRCAESFPFHLAHAFRHVFVARSHHSELPVTGEAGAAAEYTFFEGRRIQVEPVAAEEFALALPERPLCSHACKGICQRCGKNLNEGPCGCVEETEAVFAGLGEWLESKTQR